MSNFDPLLEALRKFKSSGDEGFEGLLRDCLETLAQRTLRLQKSGAQGGAILEVPDSMVFHQIQIFWSNWRSMKTRESVAKQSL
jgi:hypothetical protein